ncbi:MAG: hypothetical protein LRY41_00175 [Candidatus Pacebacteria bacterium]|nr:hypothetical protein [Candidatus Paceibacterota bacterium]MCD8508393.1 hypothetical protein [Candidatus Paceibacterota bacterium]MCD8527752.1 hypothetical protein [Candidatus Paceibacterota bacterium]MCD8563708.1 hypothetical protein [Candidatus Paceibacterota bacterium]
MKYTIHTPQDITRYFTVADHRLPHEVFLSFSAQAQAENLSLDEVIDRAYMRGELKERDPYDYRNFETTGSFYNGIDSRCSLVMMHAITTLQQTKNYSFQEAYRKLLIGGAIIPIV